MLEIVCQKGKHSIDVAGWDPNTGDRRFRCRECGHIILIPKSQTLSGYFDRDQL